MPTAKPKRADWRQQPRKGKQKRDARLSIKIMPADHRSWKHHAAACEMSLADWVIRACRHYVDCQGDRGL